MRGARESDDDLTPARGEPAPGSLPLHLVTDDTQTVGFLDAHDTAPIELVDAVLAAFASLADGAILTVHSRLPHVQTTLTPLCDDHRIAVIGSIAHPAGGTTLTLRR